jgi:multiple sugar transport system permease protein
MGTLRVEPLTYTPVKSVPLTRWRFKWSRLALHLGLIAGSVIMLLPFVWMVATSLKAASEVLTATPTFWPRAWRWENYVEIFTRIPFGRMYFNTLFITLGRVAGQLLVASLAAYSFARLRFPGRDLIFVGVLAVMMVPQAVMIVPTFFLYKQLGWLNTYQGLIIPYFFSAFGTFLLRQYFLTIPKDLEDAAVLDGCHTLQVYWHVALPLARPAIIALGVLLSLGSWNDFLWPLIVTKSTDMHMLAVGISFFSRGQYIGNVALLMAAASVAVLPMLILFLLAQRQLIEGITLTGIQG